MEDLETNPLYKAFLGRFRREFEIACKMSYLIAIPHSESLDELPIDQFLANSHILMPSKLLKMHYTPLQAGHTEDIEELEGNKLVVYLGRKKPDAERFVVNILDQELGYNVNNREFRTVLIDRPLLDLNMPRPPLLRSIFLAPLLSSPKLNRLDNNNATSNKLLRFSRRPPKPLTNHDNCLKYLEFISQELTMELEGEVKKLQSRYMILSQYLDDAALRIKTLAEVFVPRYESHLLTVTTGNASSSNFLFSSSTNNNHEILGDSLQKSIALAVENYIVYLLHGKLITLLYQQHEREDRVLMKKFELIQRNRLTICQLGAQSAFSEFLLTEEIKQEFRCLPGLQSPLSMVSSLMKCVQLITESLNQSVRFRDQFGTVAGEIYVAGRKCAESKVTICSDDLIASFVYALAHSKPAYLYSTSRYLETFGFSSSAKDQAAYYMATFQIVIQYIYNFTPELPEQTSNHHQTNAIQHKQAQNRDNVRFKTLDDDDDHDDTMLMGDNDASCLPDVLQPTSNHQTFLSDSLDSRESTSTE